MKILALCDSPTLTTGFGRVAQNLLRRFAAAGAVVDVWAIAFKGWEYKKHPYINEFFPAGGGGEWCAPQALTLFLAQLARGGYTHVWIMQDTFLLSPNGFPKTLAKVCRERNIHSTLYFPVDAELHPDWTNIISAVDAPVAYTYYGKGMAERALAKTDFGPRAPIQVVPHGVDTNLHQPCSRERHLELRDTFWNMRWMEPDDFLMLNVNMNQRRKDVARSLEIEAELKRRGVPAKLLMHMPETSPDQLSLTMVAQQLGLRPEVDWSHHGALFRHGQSTVTEEKLVELYQLADCYLTTSLGEGWGLGITEALGCGLPVAVPRHTACQEIAEGLMARGMGDRVIHMLPEEHAWFLENDNSRRRSRTNVKDAADKIQVYYDSGRWKEKPQLTPEVREWLSWDRIAAEFLKLMGSAECGVRSADSVQTSEGNVRHLNFEELNPGKFGSGTCPSAIEQPVTPGVRIESPA